MEPLLTAEQMKAADREAITGFGLPELVLMEHAGLSIASRIETRFGAALKRSRGLVLAGPGNNGGDALVAARLLHEKGCRSIEIVLMDKDGRVSDATNQQLFTLRRLGFTWRREVSSDQFERCHWVLDGLLGTGLSRNVDGALRPLIQRLNEYALSKWILSIDIPSGLCANTGNPRGVAVHASETVSLGFLKRGLVTGQAASYVGRLHLAPIQIPRTVKSDSWRCFLYDIRDASRLPPRFPSGHKGNYGHVGIIAGAGEKQGAAGIAAVGALKGGCGLATILGPSADMETLRKRLALEVMSEALKDDSLAGDRFQSLVIGPGLGTDDRAWATVQRALKWVGPVVVDADALTLLAARAKLGQALLAERKGATILTPHPKEAARLLGGDETWRIQDDRYAAVETLARQWNSTVVLKGRGTVIGSPTLPTLVVNHGDTGLSKGGAGDLLTGLIASFLAQGVSVGQAVPLGVYVQGRASELLSGQRGHGRSSLATEIGSWIPRVFSEINQWLQQSSRT